MLRKQQILARAAALAGLAGASATVLGNPPPRRQPDPISIDRVSPSLGFGNLPCDLYGDTGIGAGWDVGGPGPVMHTPFFDYGLVPGDNVDGVSNNEFDATRQQFVYFSGSVGSMGRPATPYRNQWQRNQAAGDRYVTSGRTSISPMASALGGGVATLVGIIPVGAPPHILSANQTQYNEIPSIPPPAFNPAANAIDNMDGLEITRIDVNGDRIHDTWVYFSLDAASPSNAATGGATIYFSPPAFPGFAIYATPAQLGLVAGDDIDGLAVWDRQQIGAAQPNIDCVMFSLRPGSPSLAGRSPADVFVSALNGTFRLYLTAASIGMLATDDVDGLDVEPALNAVRPEFFDWWVQRVNIDVPYCPPPWNPPFPPPANDFHVVLNGIAPGQVRDLWTGSFPNATITGTTTPAVTQLNWAGATVPAGGMAHFGWEVMDDTPLSTADLYWTINGTRIDCRPIPDLVQTWRVDAQDGTQQRRVVDVLVNRSPEPVLVQRRAAIRQQPITLADLMVGTELWDAAVPVDPSPMLMSPGQTVELPFPATDADRGFAVLYDVQQLTQNGPATAIVYMTAMSVEQSEDLNEPLGACCIEGKCIELSPTACSANAGQYLGNGSACAAITCRTLTGDANCDGSINNFDIDCYVIGILQGSSPTAPAQYLAIGGTAECWSERSVWGDTNHDNAFNNFDIDRFVQCILSSPAPGQGCP